MRILFTRFPLESRFGGAEVQTLALMRGLKEKGYEVSFLGSCSVLLEKCRELQVASCKLDIGIPPVTKFGAFSFLWRCWRMKREILRAFETCNLQPATICMLSLSEKLLLTSWALRHGIRVIWIEHDRVSSWLAKNPWLPHLRKLSRSVTTVVVSELSKKIYVNLGWNPERVIAIPNGIDVSRLKTTSGERRVTSEVIFHIGTIARLTKDKGVDVLIDAVHDLSNVTLTIVGTGPEESSLRACTTSRPHNLTITPWTNDLPAFYQSLDCFVLPSREHDPFGLVAGEAMLLGIPTIVTDACGIGGYLTHEKDALVVRAGSREELHNAIARLASDPAFRNTLAKEGQKTAEKLFSMDQMVRRYEELLGSK